MPNCFVLVLKGANLTSRQIDHPAPATAIEEAFIAENNFTKVKTDIFVPAKSYRGLFFILNKSLLCNHLLKLNYMFCMISSEVFMDFFPRGNLYRVQYKYIPWLVYNLLVYIFITS